MKGFLITAVVILFFVGFVALAISLFGSISVIPRLANTTEQMGETVSMQNIGLQKVRYHNATEELCHNETEGIVIADIIYDATDLPETCELLVDARFEKRVKLPPCDNCTLSSLSLDIRRQDLFVPHTIELCCDGYCIRKTLRPLC